MIQRRSFLAASAAAVGAPRATQAAVETFDFTKAADNLRAIVKLEGSLDGSPGVMWCTGTVMKLIPGALAEPLYGYERCQVRAFRPRGDGSYDVRKHNWMLLKDLKTGTYLPQGGFHVLNTPMHYSAEGISWGAIKTEPKLIASPMVLPWTQSGNDIWVTLGFTLRTPGEGGAMSEETQTLVMRARTDDLFNPAIANVPCLLHESMAVPDAKNGKGYRLFQGHGNKVATPMSLPAAFLAESEKRFPGVVTKPMRWE